MKRLWCCMLLSCMLLISCSPISSEISSTEESKETQAFVFPETDNKEGTLYFTCKNWDSDIYMKYTASPQKQVYIISLEPLNPEEIKITVPIQNDYAVMMTSANNEQIKLTDYLLNKDNTEGIIISDYTFKYYLYQCYRGTDWKKMKELYDAAEEADKNIAEWTGSRNDEEFVALKETIEKYEAYRDLYVEDYKALTSEDLPTFYFYAFSIRFGRYATSYDEYGFATEYKGSQEVISETFNTIDIQIGETTYTQDIGEVRLHAEAYPEHMKMYSNYDYIEVTEWPAGPTTNPWGDGVISMCEMKFTAEEDLTLTKMYLYEHEAAELAAHVLISDSSGEDSIDFYWDLKSPVDIEKGKEVSVQLFIQDTRAIQLEYGSRCCTVIEYTVDSETYVYMQEQNMDRWPGYNDGVWIRYAAVFDGLSEELESYFNDYYYPVYETWREDLH